MKIACSAAETVPTGKYSFLYHQELNIVKNEVTGEQ